MSNDEMRRKIRHYINVLKSANEFDRAAAAAALEEFKENEAIAVPYLVAALKDTSVTVASCAARALAQMPVEKLVEFLPAIGEAAFHERSLVWAAAINVLDKVGQPAVHQFAQIVEKGDVETRELALTILKNFGTGAEPAIPAIVKALKGNNSGYAVQLASDVIANVGAKAGAAVLPLLEAAARGGRSDDVTKATNAVYRVGREALPHLCLALRHEELMVRRVAAGAFIKLGEKLDPWMIEALPDLIAALSDDDVLVRRDVAWSLGKLGEDAAEAIPVLRDAVSDSDFRVREAAAFALGEIDKSAETAPLLIGLLRDTDGTVAAIAGEALARMGARALPHLYKAAGRDVKLRTQLVGLCDRITHSVQRVTGVRQVDERPSDFHNVVRSMTAPVKRNLVRV